jgi:hypothetical protein
MSRLRQYYASRYTSAEATNSEFENIIRYLNSAELGNATLAELLAKLFDSDGNLNLGLSFRYDPATGIEVMTDPVTPVWTLLVAAENLRGAAGSSIGTIEAPLFSNRVDSISIASQTAFPYVASSSSNGNFNIVVWINGLLQAESTYAYSSVTGNVTLTSPPATGSLVTIATIRTNPVTAYRRSDQSAAASQSTFPFPFTTTEEIMVYRNGILQREGGSYDFVKNQATSTITMTSAQTSGNIISILCVSNTAIKDVAGLMLEDKYATDGKINMSAINMPDGSVTQAKVNGLVTALANKAKITVSTGTPSTPATGDLWVNTSISVPTLLFYDGIRWLNASPNGLIPLSLPANSLQFLRLNSTATALEYATIDTTGLVPTSTVGAANGVASLNSLGKVPSSQVPDFATKAQITGRVAGSIANADYVIGHLYGGSYTITGIVGKLSSGTCTVQLLVGGVNVGSTLGATSTSGNLAISTTTIDATAAIKDVVLRITGGATPVDLSYMVNSSITG